MKFRIKHFSRIFDVGIAVPWIVAIVAVALYFFLEFNITYEAPTKFVVRLLAVCGIVEILFIVLRIAESICGAKIIIEDDHVYVKMLLRRRKLYFDEIADTKYRHYEATRDNRGRKQRSGSLLYKLTASDEKTQVRSELTFYLLTGNPFRLNDEATNYEWKQKKWITDPGLDPDEDVKLYQAYKCYCHSYRRYYDTLRTADAER